MINDGTSDVIMTSGEEIMLKLYRENVASLDLLRLHKFYEKVSSTSKFVQSENLCPTTSSARLLSCRVSDQVQTWLGNVLDACSWGWKQKKMED